MDTYGTVRGSVLRCREEKRKDCVFLAGVLRVWTRDQTALPFVYDLGPLTTGRRPSTVTCITIHVGDRGSGEVCVMGMAEWRLNMRNTRIEQTHIRRVLV